MQNREFFKQFSLFQLTCTLHDTQINFLVKNKETNKYSGHKFSQDTLPNVLKSQIDHIGELYDYLQQTPQCIKYVQNSLLVGIKTGLFRLKQVEFPLKVFTEIPNQLLLKENEKILAREKKLSQKLSKTQIAYEKCCLELQQNKKHNDQMKKSLEDKIKIISYLEFQNTKLNFLLQKQICKNTQDNRMKSQKIQALQITHQKEKEKMEFYQHCHKEICQKKQELEEMIIKLEKEKKDLNTKISTNESQIFNLRKQIDVLTIYSMRETSFKINNQAQTQMSEDQIIVDQLEDDILRDSLYVQVSQYDSEENQGHFQRKIQSKTTCTSISQSIDMKFNLSPYSKDIQKMYAEKNVIGPFNELQQVVLDGQTKIYPKGIQSLEVRILNCSKCNFILGLNAVSSSKHQYENYKIYLRSDGQIASNDRRSDNNMKKHEPLSNLDLVVFQLNFVVKSLNIFVNGSIIQILPLPNKLKYQQLEYYNYYVKLSEDAQIKLL